MDSKKIQNVLKQLDEKTKKRKFSQAIELIINFRGMDVKKQENLFETKVQIPHPTGRERSKTLLFAKTASFAEKAKETVDKVIMETEIPKISKKQIQEITSFDELFAEGPVMITVGKHLGQALAPKGKMPKPVNPEITELKKALAGTKSALYISNKKGKGVPFVQAVVGYESMPTEHTAENTAEIYKAIVKALPKHEQNIKSIYLKKTMGPAIKIE